MGFSSSGGTTNVDEVTIKRNTSNQLVAIASIPVGAIIPFLKSESATPTMPNIFVECNGQVLSDAESVFDGETIPDLNGFTGTQKFLRGGGSSDGSTPTASGATDGADSHTHTIAANTLAQAKGGDANDCALLNHNHGGVTGGGGLPTHFEVVYIMRIK